MTTQALSFEELERSVASRDLFAARSPEASLREWWLFALRRQLLQPVELAPGTYALTDRGRTAVADARRKSIAANSPEIPAGVLYLIPSGAAGLVVSIASVGAQDPTIWSIAAAVAMLAVFMVAWATFLDLVVSRVVHPRVTRLRLRRATCWLDGAAVHSRLPWIAEPAVDVSLMYRLTDAPRHSTDASPVSPQ